MSKPHNIIIDAQNFVREYLNSHLHEDFVYHNYNHTKNVVDATIELANGAQLDQEEMEVAVLAAWFHDVGYATGEHSHETHSVEIATSFLEGKHYPPENIEKIGKAILTTQMPQSPETTLEKILCDADLSALGTDSFIERSKLLRIEKELTSGKVLNEFDWIRYEIEFLSKHEYHTDFAKSQLDKTKAKNIQKLKKRLNRETNLNLPREKELADLHDLSKSEKKSKKKKKKKNKASSHGDRDLSKLSRGVETMFRQAMRNHIQLSAIADNKANIMLSINAIILSIVISTLVPQFLTNPKLIPPTAFLLLICLITIIFATLSTRPKITEGKFSKESVETKRANLIFFGNFYNMALADFESGMRQAMQDEDFLYGMLTRDLYFLGKVLAKKYKYLRICYTVFMYGIIITVIVFAISFATFSGV